MISPNTASTPGQLSVSSRIRGRTEGHTRLASIPTCYSADGVHVPQDPCTETQEELPALREGGLTPSGLSIVGALDLSIDLVFGA